VLEKQSKALLRLPTKQCKEEVAAVEVRRAAARCARWAVGGPPCAHDPPADLFVPQ
jgi:hypothetical protein